MAIVHVSSVADGLNEQSIRRPIPGDDSSVVPDTKFVVRISGKRFQPVIGPLCRFVDLVEYAIGYLGFQSIQLR